jgi:hypothetical protein
VPLNEIAYPSCRGSRAVLVFPRQRPRWGSSCGAIESVWVEAWATGPREDSGSNPGVVQMSDRRIAGAFSYLGLPWASLQTLLPFVRSWKSREFRRERHPPVSGPSAMNAAPASPYDAPPDFALAAVLAHRGPLLIDLDETLYLRNSTEDFIDCAQAGVLALLSPRVLDVLKPWWVTGGINTRGTWRLCAISTLPPWTHWRGHSRVQFLAEHYANQKLRAAPNAQAEPPVILTMVFKSIVRSPLTATKFTDAQLTNRGPAPGIFAFGIALAVLPIGYATPWAYRRPVCRWQAP